MEIDHIPSRVLFDERQWPEGYEFPACVPCNRATRHDEQVVAMLSRAYLDAITLKGKNQTQKIFRAVAYNYPEILTEMQPTIRQKRNAAKKYNIAIAKGESSADIPALSGYPPRLTEKQSLPNQQQQ